MTFLIRGNAWVYIEAISSSVVARVGLKKREGFLLFGDLLNVSHDCSLSKMF